MLINKEKKYCICSSCGNLPLFFNGKILDEDEEYFLMFEERENQELFIFKVNIVWVKEVKIE